MHKVPGAQEFLNKKHFYLRRLHSLCGLFPIGVFLMEHLFTNSFASRGEKIYADRVQFILDMPYLLAIEVFMLVLPIGFHSIYGLYITRTGSPNAAAYPYSRNFAYFLQRVTGILMIVFLVLHLYFFRFGELKYHYGSADFFPAVAHKMAKDGWFLFYVVGVAASVFHFANGLWSAAITWGLTVGPRSQKYFYYACMGLFLAMSAAGIHSLYTFRRAAFNPQTNYKDWTPPASAHR